MLLLDSNKGAFILGSLETTVRKCLLFPRLDFPKDLSVELVFWSSLASHLKLEREESIKFLLGVTLLLCAGLS